MPQDKISLHDTTSPEVRSVTVDREDVASTVKGWMPDAPPEVLAAIDDLQVAVNRHEPTYALELFLGIEIAREPRWI